MKNSEKVIRIQQLRNIIEIHVDEATNGKEAGQKRVWGPARVGS